MDYNISYRDKNGSIQAIISYKDGSKWKQKSKQGFKTQKAAKPWIEKTLEELEKDLKFDYNTELEGITFDELFIAYMNHATLYKGFNTLKNYDLAYKHFDINNKKVKDINILELQQGIDNMVRIGLSEETIKSYVAKIKIVFEYAKKPLKIISENPMEDIIVPHHKNKEVKKVKALTKKELDDLLSKIKYKKHYLVSLVAATTGLRLGEILGLTWDNIDEKKAFLKVEKQWKIISKDLKEYGFGPLKSKNSYRTVPIPMGTLKELKEYKKSEPIHISNRIFPYARNDSFGSGINKLYKKLGFEITLHGLRHTYASMLVGSGMDFKSVAELLGHSVEETIETYSHFTSDMMDRAKKVIESIF